MRTIPIAQAPAAAKPELMLDEGGNLFLSGALSQGSDANNKQNFAAVDPTAVLDRLAALPISAWSYKSDTPQMRHLGPTAQDFYAAFGLGADDTHIAPLDASSVAIAGIQSLNTQVQSLHQQVADLQAQNAALEARLDALEANPAAPLPTALLALGLAAPTPAAYPLIGYMYNAATGHEHIVRIDPATGAITTLLELTTDRVLPDAFALDPSNLKVYLVTKRTSDLSYRLSTIGLDNGTILSVVVNTGQGGFGFTLAGPGKLAGYDFNPDANNPTSAPTWRLITIDPATGAVTQVALLGNDFNMGAGKLAVDIPAHLAFLSGNRPDTPTRWPVYCIDLQNGASCGPLTVWFLAGTNMFGFQLYPGGKVLFLAASSGDALFGTFDWNTSQIATIGTLPAGTFDYYGSNQFAVTPGGETALLAGQAHGENGWRLFQVPLGASPPAPTSVVLNVAGARRACGHPPGLSIRCQQSDQYHLLLQKLGWFVALPLRLCPGRRHLECPQHTEQP